MRFILLLLVPLLAACAATREPPGLPAALADEAVIPGYEGPIWAWGDAFPKNLREGNAAWRRQMRATRSAEGRYPNAGRIDVLILSGGGSDGAHGAGLLDAWDEVGDRPKFTVVTGISIGALIAPFAFLGADYDATLREVLDRIGEQRQVRLKPFFGIFSGAAASDTTTMEQTLADLFTDEMVEAIGREHARGRRLWIGTTNLDAQRPVIWNVGAIAASGRPGSAALIRDILRASAAIPGLLPPVAIEVEAAGRRYTQIHVDGGVTRQLFLHANPAADDLLGASVFPGLRPGTIYVVRNSTLQPEYELVELDLLSLTRRSISTLIRSNAADNSLLIAQVARSTGFEARFTSVPPDLGLDEEELFDIDYMRALYAVGEARMRAGEVWVTGRELLSGVGIAPTEEP